MVNQSIDGFGYCPWWRCLTSRPFRGDPSPKAAEKNAPLNFVDGGICRLDAESPELRDGDSGTLDAAVQQCGAWGVWPPLRAGGGSEQPPLFTGHKGREGGITKAMK